MHHLGCAGAREHARSALISLELSEYDAPGLVSFARILATGLSPNPSFTAADLAKLPVSVADLQTCATALETTHNSRPTTPSRASTKLEGDQATTLMEAIKGIAGFVENFANIKGGGDLAKAEAIERGAGASRCRKNR